MCVCAHHTNVLRRNLNANKIGWIGACVSGTAVHHVSTPQRRAKRQGMANSVNFPRQLISLGNVKYLNVADYLIRTQKVRVCEHTIPGDSNYKVSDEYHYAKYIARSKMICWWRMFWIFHGFNFVRLELTCVDSLLVWQISKCLFGRLYLIQPQLIKLVQLQVKQCIYLNCINAKQMNLTASTSYHTTSYDATHFMILNDKFVLEMHTFCCKYRCAIYAFSIGLKLFLLQSIRGSAIASCDSKSIRRIGLLQSLINTTSSMKPWSIPRSFWVCCTSIL